MHTFTKLPILKEVSITFLVINVLCHLLNNDVAYIITLFSNAA